MPEGHRRGHGRLDCLRGRRFLAVRDGVGVRGLGGIGALRAFRRRVAMPRRHSQGRKQAPAQAARRGRLALQGRVEVAEGPGQGSIGRRGDQTPRQRRREAPGRQASRLGRGRQAEQRGQRRGRARAGVLVLGRWPHGGRRLARAAHITGSLPAFPGSTGVGPHPRIFFVRRRSRHARSKTDEPEGPAVATRCTGAFCAMGEY